MAHDRGNTRRASFDTIICRLPSAVFSDGPIQHCRRGPSSLRFAITSHRAVDGGEQFEECVSGLFALNIFCPTTMLFVPFD